MDRPNGWKAFGQDSGVKMIRARVKKGFVRDEEGNIVKDVPRPFQFEILVGEKLLSSPWMFAKDEEITKSSIDLLEGIKQINEVEVHDLEGVVSRPIKEGLNVRQRIKDEKKISMGKSSKNKKQVSLL
jgi:hypothetical protein